MARKPSGSPESVHGLLAPSGLIKWFFLAFGVFSSLIFLVEFFYGIGFVANLVVPKSIDSGTATSELKAVFVNLFLMGLFGVSHSGMARPAFKKWWDQRLPPQIGRSAYVLIASLLLLLMYWLWLPIPGVVWNVGGGFASVLWVLYGIGWILVIWATILMDPLDLLGLRQVVHYARGISYLPPPFRTPALYRVVRHPIMLGFLIAFWAAPTMTWGHLLFSGVMTIYIFVGIALEERDLQIAFGKRFEAYRREVGMIVPRFGKK